MYSLKMRAHSVAKEQPENDSLVFSAENEPQDPIEPTIAPSERFRLARIEWTILRPLYNLLSSILTAESRGATHADVRAHRRHSSVPVPVAASSSTDPVPTATYSQLQDPAVAFLSKELPDSAIRASLNSLPHCALKCLIITLIERRASPNVHRRFFRIVARVSTESRNHRLRYHRILNEDAKFLFQGDVSRLQLIDLVLVMCDSYPDEEGSRIIFKESQNAWDASLPPLVSPEMEEIVVSWGTSSLGCVTIDRNGSLRRPTPIYAPLGGTSLSLAYGFTLISHQLLSRLIGYGLPPMRLNLIRRKNTESGSKENPFIAMLVQGDRSHGATMTKISAALLTHLSRAAP